MTNNRSAGAIGRVGAAGERDALMPAAVVARRDFADAAALIARLAAPSAGDIAAEPDCTAAIERTADIATRSMPPSAMPGCPEASARRAREAGESPRELAHHVIALMRHAARCLLREGADDTGVLLQPTRRMTVLCRRSPCWPDVEQTMLQRSRPKTANLLRVRSSGRRSRG
jgi:hypothetical protein